MINETQIQEIVDFLIEIEESTNIDIINNIELNEIDFDDAFNSIYQAIEENNGFEIEIIYYSNAIEYLKENDPSLMKSIEIAENYGYEIKNINSELLASLHASQNSRDIFFEYQNKINNFFNNL